MPTQAQTSDFPLYLIALFPFLGAAINLILGRKLPRKLIHLVACASVLASAVVAFTAVLTKVLPMWWALRHSQSTHLPEIHDLVFNWIQAGKLNINLAFVLDPLSSVMVLTVTFVGFLIHVYSTGYMSHDPRPHAYFGYLNLFTGAMLLLVLGDSLPVMFIGWEGVGVCSYLLIGFWFDKEKNANAGRKAFVVNRIGDFAFLLGIFLLFTQMGTMTFDGLREAAPALGSTMFMGMPVAFWAGLLLFIGACGKSAQIPLYVWLPDAMAGPTPVSALIHAATMVTAGVYMTTRLGFLYNQAPQVQMIIALVGTATAVLAAIIGFAQTDIKKVLAYSTVSQLGFMFAAVGCGAYTAAIFHLFTHAFFKAGLFLGAGSVMHAMGDRTEIMEMGGLRKKIPITHGTFLIYCLAIAGILPFAGFFSKDEILLGAFMQHGYGKLVWVLLSLSALGTAFYMWRLYFLVFAGKSRASAEVQAHIHESPKVMTMPLVVLAIGACVLGFLGLPHVGHLPNIIGKWLDGTFSTWGAFAPHEHEVAQGTTLGLMGFALLAGIIGIGLAYAMYGKGPDKGKSFAAAIAPLHKLVVNKFYVDELYDVLFVRPFRWIARAIYNFVDRFLIDMLLVNGSAWITDKFGRILRFLQNGDIQRYLAATVLGLVAILWWTARPGTVSFKNAGDARQMKFTADIGKGATAKEAKVVWDFDGDDKSDAEGLEVTWSFQDKPGTYKVTMWVEDKVYGDKGIRQVSRKVEVAAHGTDGGTAAAGGGQ